MTITNLGYQGNFSTVTLSPAKVPFAKPKIEDDFLKIAKMSPMERMRTNILKKIGLTEDDLKSLPDEKRQAVEEKIRKDIRDEMEKKEKGKFIDINA